MNPSHLETLRSIVEIKSLSGKESQLAAYISNWFKERGIESFMQDRNVVVHLPGEDSTLACIMNSHMDTVAAGQGWKTDPWKLTIEDDRAFGLGTSDMKAGLASSMHLAESINSQGRPPVDYWFTYVVEEEVDGSGTRSFADWFEQNGYLKQYIDVAAIFTEPTNMIEIEHGHRGNIFIKATATGDSGHSSRPQLIKRHAAEVMFAFAKKLQESFQVWRSEYESGEFEPPTLGSFTSIKSGLMIQDESPEQKSIVPESLNKIPSTIEATFDVRTVPGFHEDAINLIQQVAEEFEITVELAANVSPSGYTKKEDPFVQAALETVPHAILTVSQGAADLGFLTAKGIKAIIFGPGVKEVIHQPNEYCYPAELPVATRYYQQIFENWIKAKK